MSDAELFRGEIFLVQQTLEHGACGGLWIVTGSRFVGCENRVSLDEIGVKSSIGETLATDTNALEYTVARQLVEHQCRIY
jgi:hypothetical protein